MKDKKLNANKKDSNTDANVTKQVKIEKNLQPKRQYKKKEIKIEPNLGDNKGTTNIGNNKTNK